MSKFRAFAGAMAASALVMFACSSSDDGGAPGTTTPPADDDAAVTPAADTGAGADAHAQADAGSDASPSTTDPCAVEAAYQKRCNPDSGVSAACASARAAQCPQLVALQGALLTNSTLHCESATSACDDTANTDCSNDELAKVVATAAQNKVRDDLCTRCGGGTDAIAECKVEFFYDPDAGGPGVGIVVLASSDGLAKQIDTTCAIPDIDGGEGDCQLDFYDCAGTVHDDAQPADPAACAGDD